MVRTISVLLCRRHRVVRKYLVGAFPCPCFIDDTGKAEERKPRDH